MTKTSTWRRIAVNGPKGRTLFFDPEEIFYLEADEHDTFVRSARKTPYRATQRLATLSRVLPSPPFFRCHSSYVVHLGRIRSLERRSPTDYVLRLDPPVNAKIPLARNRVPAFRKLMGAP